MSKFDDALNRMRNDLVRPESKIEGTFSMFNLRAVAQESALVQNMMEITEQNYTIMNAKGAYLDAVAKDYGFYRKLAAYSVGEIMVTGTEGLLIPAGTEFSAPEYGVSFEVRQDGTITGGTATLEAQCTEFGSKGNVPAGVVTKLLSKLEGIESAVNNEPFTGGVDTEDDSNLRMRILFYIQNPHTSGNKNDYISWSTEVNGVGAVKVFALWNGPGTVKVSVLDSNGDPATPELLEDVKNHIDPGDGDGSGVAPVGAVVTVTTATGKAVSVTANVELSAGKTIDGIKTAFTEQLRDYFRSIAYDEKTDGVSAARVGFILMQVEGVVDYTDLMLNGSTSSITIGSEEVLQVGDVTFTEIEGA